MILQSTFQHGPEAFEDQEIRHGKVLIGKVLKVHSGKNGFQTVTTEIYDTPEVMHTVFVLAENSKAFERMAVEMWPIEFKLWRI